MARLLVQSGDTGKFLCPGLWDGQPVWVRSLREAGGGVVSDLDAARQLVRDWCEPDDLPVLVDLDRLGTADDYPVTEDKSGASNESSWLVRCPDCGSVYDCERRQDGTCPDCGSDADVELGA